jgi:hypothetical protein
MAKVFSKMSFQLSKGKPGYHGLGPRGLRSRTLPSRHAGGSLGLFVEQLMCTPKTKGLRTLFKINPTPCKKKKTNTTIHAHSVFTVCACNKQKKLKKIGVLGSFEIVRKMRGEKGKIKKWM